MREAAKSRSECLPLNEQNRYWIYMLELENGCYYTGYTRNLEERFRLHLLGTASKITRSFKPVSIIQCWRLTGTQGTAKRIEALIKGLNRQAKERLVEEPSRLREIIKKRLNLEPELACGGK